MSASLSLDDNRSLNFLSLLSDRWIAYEVQPSDNFTKILTDFYGPLAQGTLKNYLAKLTQLNKHIRNPNYLFPGQLILIPTSPERQFCGNTSEVDLLQMDHAWRNSSPATKAFVRSHWDILDLCEEGMIGTEASYESTRSLAKVLEKSPPFFIKLVEQVREESTIFVNLVLERRKQAQRFIVEYSEIFRKRPVFVMKMMANSLFGFGKKLDKFVEIGNNLHLNEAFLLIESTISALKVRKKWKETHDPRATFIKVGEELGDGGGAYLGMRLGTRLCFQVIEAGASTKSLYGVAGGALGCGAVLYLSSKVGQETVGTVGKKGAAMVYDSVAKEGQISQKFKLPSLIPIPPLSP